MSNGSPAPRERLAELREFLVERIDGSEETRAWDSKLTRFIEAIDALPSEMVAIKDQRTECGEESSADSSKPQGSQVANPASVHPTPKVDLLERTTMNPADWVDLARLIAAAPEMLAALKGCIEASDKFRAEHNVATESECLIAVRAAIAKAENK